MTPEQRLELRQRDDDLRDVLSTGAGRRVIWRLVDEMGRLHAGSYSEERTHQTAYLEGRRAVALELVRESMRVAPLLYAQALGEALEAKRLRDEEAARRAEREG